MEQTTNNPQEKHRKSKSPKNDGESSSTKSFWDLLDLSAEQLYKCLPGIVFCLYSVFLVHIFYRFYSVSEIRNVKYDVTSENYWIQLDEFQPYWANPYDISRVKVVFEPKYDDSYRYHVIHIDNVPLSEVVFSSFSIEPDWITKNEIHYESWGKLTKLKEEGLSFYVNFPEMQSQQMTRITIITVLISMAFQKVIETSVELLSELVTYFKKELENKMTGKKA